MTSMQDNPRRRRVVVGVDTHKHIHVAVALDALGGRVDARSFAADRSGYEQLIDWALSLGREVTFGVEGTGSYGAGLASAIRRRGIGVLEVLRTDRRDRRLRGKSDTLDAENAARAVLAGRRTTTPKTKDGQVESLRVLRLTRSTAVKSRRAAMQLLRNHIVSAPEELRDQVRNFTRMQLIRTCAAWRPDATGFRDPVVATRIALRSLARRILALNDEIADLDDLIAPLVEELAPALVQAPGIGVEIAGQLPVTAAAARRRCGPPPRRPNGTG